jgi:lipopolysaccharide export system permease protein
MKPSTRLVFTTVLPMVLIAWLAMLAMITLLELKDQLVKVGQDFDMSTMFGILLMTTPRRAYEYFVYASVIGTAIGMGQLAQSSELIALRALGISKLKIIGAALLAVLVLTLVVMGANEFVGAAGERRAQALAAGSSAQDISVGAKSGLWLKDGSDFVNAKRAVLNEGGKPVELWDVRLIHSDESGSMQSFTRAQSATYEIGRGWFLHNVVQQDLDGNTKSSALLPWASKLQPAQLASRTLRPSRQSLREIWANLEYAKQNGLAQQAFSTALWQKLSYPITIIVLAFAVAPFAFTSLRTGGLGRSIMIGILLAIVFFVLQRMIVSVFDTYGWSMAVAHLLPPSLIFIFSLHRLRRDA